MDILTRDRNGEVISVLDDDFYQIREIIDDTQKNSKSLIAHTIRKKKQMKYCLKYLAVRWTTVRRSLHRFIPTLDEILK